MHNTVKNLLDIKNNIKDHLNKLNINNNPKIIAVSKTFKINKIPEGIYSLMFYNDRDENDYYSHGSLSPYQSSEWFEIIPDTISIRSNWDMEITNIKLNSF